MRRVITVTLMALVITASVAPAALAYPDPVPITQSTAQGR